MSDNQEEKTDFWTEVGQGLGCLLTAIAAAILWWAALGFPKVF